LKLGRSLLLKTARNFLVGYILKYAEMKASILLPTEIFFLAHYCKDLL